MAAVPIVLVMITVLMLIAALPQGPKFQSRYVNFGGDGIACVNYPYTSLHTSTVIHTRRTYSRSLTRSTMLKESNESNVVSHQKSGMTSLRPSHSNGNSHAGKPRTHTARTGTTIHAHRLSAGNTSIHENSSNGNSYSNSATVNIATSISISKSISISHPFTSTSQNTPS